MRKPPVATWKVAVSVELRDVLFHGLDPGRRARSMRPAGQARACLAASAAVKMADGIQHELAGEAFAALPDISIDYALMERSARVAVVPAAFDWSDIGSWGAMSALLDADAEGNRGSGDTLFVDTRNTFVQSDGRLVATVGVDDLVVWILPMRC